VTTYAHADAAHPGDVSSVTDPDGRVASMTYDPAGNVATRTTTPTAGVSNTAEYSHDGDSELVCSVSPVKRAAGIHCPAPGTNPPAGAQAISYNADGEVTAATDALGHPSSFLYDLNGNRTDATDPRALVTKSTFDADNRVLSVTAGYGTASASTTGAAYDIPVGSGACIAAVPAAVYCHTSTDAAGNVTVNYYTATDAVAGSTRAGDQTTTNGYDLAGRILTVKAPDGQTTTNGYDDDGRPTSRSYSSGSPAPVSYTYNLDGHRTGLTDATGDSTYNYDPNGRLTDTKTGSGAKVIYGHDNAGHVTNITYPNLGVVNRAFDGAGRLTSITDWLGHVTTVAPDADGNAASTRYGNAVVATSAFDAVDQMSATTIAGPTGTTLASLAYTRNENSQVASVTPTGLPGSAETYGYSSRGQLASVNTGAYTYDLVGNPTRLADGTTRTFNPANQLTSSTSGGATTSYAYDGAGNQSAIVPPTGDKTNYAYDQAARLTAVQRGKLYLPLTPARIADTRTGSGKPYAGQSLAPGGTLAVQVTGTGGVPATGVAAVVLNVTEASASTVTALTVFPTGVTRPGTSNLNPVAGGVANNEVTVPVGTGGQVSIYNALGTTNVIVDVMGYYSAGGAGMNAITPVRVADTLAGTGNPYAGTPLPANGTLTIQISGTAGVPAGASAAILQTTVVGPTAAGNLTAYPAGSALPPTSNLNYTVGATLTKEITAALGTAPSGAVTFYNSAAAPVRLIVDVTGYINSVGDALTPLTPARIADTRTGSGQPYAGSTLTAGGALTVQVTGRGAVPANASSVVVNLTVPGNTTSGYMTAYPAGTRPGTTTLSRNTSAIAFTQVTLKLSPTGTFTIWNSTGTADIIIDVMGSYGPLTSYTYNGDGLRATRTTTTGTQNFAYDPTGGVPLMLTDGAISYIYDDAGNPLEQVDAASVALYYQHDQYGSTRLLTNAAGAIAASYTYNAYGALTARTGTADTPLRWNGQYQDTDTGLYYLRTRYYNPTTAQFTTVDPATPYTGDPYNYANGDPLNHADPLGLFTCDATTRTGLTLGMNAVFAVGILIPGWGEGPDEALWAAYDAANVTRIAAEDGAGALRFSQTTASSTFGNGSMAGRSIGDVASGLRSGAIKAGELPIDVITRGGNALAMNTRSTLALMRGGVDSSQWVLNDVTGDTFLERVLTQRLAGNGLTDAGTDVLRITGAGKWASWLG